jgi:hypothetical protein
MIKSIYYVLVTILCVLMVIGCAQRGDNHNPLGLTGGSDGGYGKRQDSYYYDSAIPQNEDSVEGVWTETDKTLTIASDKTFQLKSGEEIRTGTFSRLKDKLTLDFEDGQSVTYIYNVEKGRLVLTEIE